MKSNAAPVVTGSGVFSLSFNLMMLLLLPLGKRANACMLHVWYSRSSYTKKCTHTHTHTTAPHHFIRVQNTHSTAEQSTHHTTIHCVCIAISTQHSVRCEWNVLHLCVLFIHSFIHKFFASIVALRRHPLLFYLHRLRHWTTGIQWWCRLWQIVKNTRDTKNTKNTMSIDLHCSN